MSDKTSDKEKQAIKTSDILLNCPFCKDGEIYKIQRENRIGTVIPQLFCNSCKMIFEVENDSPYLHDGKTYDYLEEKLYKTFNTRKPMERIVEHLKRKKKPTLLLGPSWLSREERISQQKGYCKAFEEAIEIVKEEGGVK